MSVPLFWQHSDNFGDALAPWLVRKITGQDPEPVDPSWDGPVPYLVTGSIFSHRVKRGIVWGAGCAFKDDLDPSKLPPPSDQLKVIATRGPLSKELVEAAGHKPVTCGDPVLLIPRFYKPKTSPTVRFGILCSWVDHVEVAARFGHSVAVLSASSPIEAVIDAIGSWEIVVSSCLHGLVAALAYGKPVLWVRFSDRMMGDGFKFRDFFASVGVDDPRCVDLKDCADLRSGLRDVYDLTAPDTDELMTCCPFLEEGTR